MNVCIYIETSFCLLDLKTFYSRHVDGLYISFHASSDPSLDCLEVYSNVHTNIVIEVENEKID